MPEDLISPQAVADRLGISVATVLRWYRVGHLHGYRRGPKVIRFSWAEVLTTLSTRLNRTATQPVNPGADGGKP
jgi:excisionase family DNA binding protein